MYARTWLKCSYKKGYHMKNAVVRALVALSFLMGFVLHSESVDIQVAQECTYDAVVVMLGQGHVFIKRYPIEHEYRENNKIFSLDLSDNNELYTSVLCDNTTKGLIVVRSDNDAMCDYCLNWGALVGVDLAQSQIAAYVPVFINTDEQRLKISGVIENKIVDLEIAMTQPVKSACAFIVPTELVDMMKINQELMSFTEGCRLGVIVAQKRNESRVDDSQERELEFDRILNSMMQDGTIQIKQVSPFMAKLRTIGSTIFVHYLAVKNVIRSWWKSCWHKPVAVDKPVAKTNQSK